MRMLHSLDVVRKSSDHPAKDCLSTQTTRLRSSRIWVLLTLLSLTLAASHFRASTRALFSTSSLRRRSSLTWRDSSCKCKWVSSTLDRHVLAFLLKKSFSRRTAVGGGAGPAATFFST